MYQHHPAFKQAKNQESKLWRYMDLTKLLSLLAERALFFGRIDKFPDRSEGLLTAADISDQYRKFQEWKETWSDDMIALNPSYEFQPQYHYFPPKFVAISCWHENEFESAAMWDLYTQRDRGIAITSTWRLLKRSIVDEHTVWVGRVKYIDRERDRTNRSNGLNPFLQKGMSYRHEREVRALVYVGSKDRDPDIPNRIRHDVETIGDGILIKVDPAVLIQSIHIAPLMPTWQRNLVKDLIKRYGFDIPVFQSRLYDDPYLSIML